VIPYNEWARRQQLILDFLAKEPVASRSEISRATGLKDSEVKSLIIYMRKRGLVNIYRVSCYSLRTKAEVMA
jgi:DNA-binding IclR family transcriptional regulator